MRRLGLPQCNCGSGLFAPARLDARRIFITYACSKCWPAKAKGYRPDVLTNPNYHCDEPIDGD